MVELGKYAAEVIAAYAVSLVLLGALIALSLLRARRLRDQLRAIESPQAESPQAEAPRAQTPQAQTRDDA